MSTLPRYCSHCGAANEPENLLCFACQRSLDIPEELAADALLNGRYQLLTQVGSGGFGGVYRAVDTAETGRIVAVKQINLRWLSTQEIIEATDGFNREVRLLSALHHPNLPAIRDTFTDPEHWYLVMDFIEGETLEVYLKSKVNGRLSLKEVLEIGLQLCTVLDYLHTRQPTIIFRDLKPSNVMRTFDGHIYLIDFGIARHFSPGKPKDTMPFGSPGYAAPEQYGRAQTTPQADIYSLGALLHYLLTGDDPAESPFRFAPLPMADSTELAELDALIQRIVATEPGERPASAAEIKIVLQRLTDEIRRRETLVSQDIAPSVSIWPGPTPIQAAPVSTRRTRRNVLANALTAGIVVAGVGGCLTASILLHQLSGGVHGLVAVPPPSPGTAKKQLVYQGHKGAITAISWSPDGTMVASGSADITVQVWRAADGALLYTLSGYSEPVTSIVWATDRSNVIASAGNPDGTVQVWDALRDHRDLIFHGDGRVLALSWKLDSPWIVSGGTDREIYTWNASTGAKGASYTGHRGNVNTVAWLPDTQAFNSSNVTLGTATPDLTITREVIASGGVDKTVQIWDANTGQNLLTYSGHQGSVNSLALITFAPGELPVYIASGSDDGTAYVWETVRGNPSIVYRGHSGKVYAMVALANVPYYGPRVASAGEDRTVQVWSSYSGRLLTVYRGHQAAVNALATSPVDNRIVSGDADGLVHLWTVTRTGYQ